MRWLLLASSVLLACGPRRGLPPVRAFVEGGRVEVSWSGGAQDAEVRLLRLDTGELLGPPVSGRGGRAELPLVAGADGVRVAGNAFAPRLGFISAGAQGGSGEAWQLFAPGDFRGGALHVRYSGVAAGEEVAVLLVNAGGPDGSSIDVGASGLAAFAAAPPVRPAASSSAVAAHEALLDAQDAAIARDAGGAPGGARRAALRTGLTGPPPAQRSFCVAPALQFDRPRRKPATLAAATAHTALYVDDEDAAEYAAAPFVAQQLAGALEERILPTEVQAFGALPDVGGDGRVVVLFTHELGPHLNGGWLIGYFGNADLLRPRDDSGDCSSGGSNGGEILYLNDLGNAAANGWPPTAVADVIDPATAAHELQHLLNLAHHCLDHRCAHREERWLDEALAKVAEDLTGYGWNTPEGRGEGARYLQRTAAGEALRGYDGRSLTLWEGDPIGNYQGAHSFLRLFADRGGTPLLAALHQGPGGVEGLEGALGLPLPRAMAEWATALLSSNGPGAAFSYSGAAWSPLHQRLRALDAAPPGPVGLRADGIAAVALGAGQGGPVDVVVRSGADILPHVVAVRAASF